MFNKNLKRIRLENNLTQKDVADFLHISPQSISKWENGEATPSIDFLPLLAELLNCKIDDFFNDVKHESINVSDLEKFAEFARVLEMDKDDPAYICPSEYMKQNPGWEDNCIAFFESMKDEKCFTAQTLQNYEKCDFETAQRICKTLEDMGCLTKAPDSKYYVTNAGNMGGFIFLIKAAKLFEKIDGAKGKSGKEFEEWLDKNI